MRVPRLVEEVEMGARCNWGPRVTQLAVSEMSQSAGHHHWSIVVWPKPIKVGRNEVIILQDIRPF